MDSLEIVLDRRDGYEPGQQVSGKVILNNCTEIKASHLTICIHGGAFTHWSEHRYSETVYFSSTVDYVKEEFLAWSASEENKKFPIGHHVFPFIFQLPTGIPPSYEGAHGRVRYSVRVELDRPWKFSKTQQVYFQVISNVDLNTLAYGNNPVAKREAKDIGSVFKKGIVTTTITIPKQAYAPGESLPIIINIDNLSTRPVYCIRAELLQHTHYHATKNSIFSSSKEYHKNETKMVAESRKTIKIAAKSVGNEELSIKIPKLIPNFGCPIIMVEYCLSVKVDTETSMNNTLHSEFPIFIGTVQINNSMTFSGTINEKTDLMLLPPPYSCSTPSAPTDDSPSPSAPPPTYEESFSTIKN
ncbi:hypothetical protein GCK72_025802 [Caenorhabditis remanei]|uniref:Arrestin C-terminal-like domain-containing protein n=1 Tax=Caenorhabditis remanei TaxID=31234 RepID=A0A6A5G3P3_CAERE|nr:hypothetical protein GCK72_025802 [Caenorhabditis remanei]KAF1749335.1 hypothetical protein GCK72_025802 [Caenorhabditis remanei]